MATVFGVNATKVLSNNPSEKAGVGEQGGRLRVIYDSYAPAGALALNDVIKMGGLIPAGARVLDAKLQFSDLGTTGDVHLGWEASADAVEAADADGFLVDADVNAAAGSVSMLEDQSTVAGMGKKFAAPVQPIITVSEATTAAGTIRMILEYVID